MGISASQQQFMTGPQDGAALVESKDQIHASSACSDITVWATSFAAGRGQQLNSFRTRQTTADKCVGADTARHNGPGAAHSSDLGLLLGTEAPAMTPDCIDFSLFFLVTEAVKVLTIMRGL